MLEEIRKLPQRVIDNLDGDIGNLKVYLVQAIEEFQGQGLGYHFLISICKNLLEQDFKFLSLTVDVDNPAAIRLYQDKMGFEIKEHRKDEYGKGHDRYIMVLDLRKYA